MRAKKLKAETSSSTPLKTGDRVVVAGAGREWTGKVVERQLPDGRSSIHPLYDDTAVYVAIDETGISMPVSVRQVSRA